MLLTRPEGNIPEEQVNQADVACPKLSDLLISYLEQLEVEYLFGVPGGAIEPLYNALARSERRGSVRAVVARHETGAAFMAHGYYMSKRRLGVCCATTGPGATNLLTGVATAYENNAPMLVITAQTAMSHFGRGAFQESSDTSVNTIGMFQYCTNYNSLVSHPQQFEQKLYAAIMTAYQTSTPSHLSIPLDIFRSASEVETPSYDLSGLMQPSQRLDMEQLNRFRDLLLGSENAVFVIGEGCIDAIGTILSVATLLRAKVVTTPHAKGLVSPYHPLFRGVIGFAGHTTALNLLADENVDLVVAIGTALSEWASNNWDANALMNEKLVHVEFLERRFTHSPMARMHVSGDIGIVFDKILSGIFSSQKVKQLRDKHGKTAEDRDKPRRHFRVDEEKKCASDAVPIKPQRLMHELTSLFPPHTCYLADVGNSFSWSVHYLHPYDRRLSGERKRGYGIYHACFEFAPMGWAIGAAVGMALGRLTVPIVCITGDGSWLMNGQEITVALQEELTVIFVILNDGALGMVKHGQILNNAERIGYRLPAVDYKAMAESVGAQGFVIESPEDLLKLDMAAICKRRGPTVLDVRVDPNEVPPINRRIKTLTLV